MHGRDWGSDVTESDGTISGGHLVARALKNEGVDVIFTLCGGHIIDIYDGCVDEGIDIIDVRHEQVAAHAADGYARMTGRPGVAVVTAGPGTTDAVTGVANALRAESPLLLIGGQGALSQHKMGSLQDLPHVDMMAPITKFAATVPNTSRVADMVSMAFRECLNGAPGPSFLEIPRDILDAKVDASTARIPEPGRYRASTRSAGDPDDIQRLADILVASERPCVLLGSQVWTCRAADAAHEFARTLNIPAYMNGAGRGTFAPGDPHHFNRTRRMAFDQADVIVIVGTPFDFRMGYGRRLREDATVVQIDMDYRTVGKNRDISLGIVGDVGLVLQSVTAAASGSIEQRRRRPQAVAGRIAGSRGEGLREAAARVPVRRGAGQPLPGRLRAQRVPHRGHHLRRRRRRRRHRQRPGGAATRSRPVDGSRPARHARRRRAVRDGREVRPPGAEVLAYFGDGAFSMTGWDFETLRPVQPAVPRRGREQLGDEPDPLRPDHEVRRGARRRRQPARRRPYDKFAQILGGYGEEVREPGQIRPALERAREAVASGTPALINIWVDIDVWAPGTRNQTMYK